MRKNGYGNEILKFMLKDLKEYKGKIYMHAQVDVIKFYETNQNLIQEMQKVYSVGTDQPVLNFMLNLSDIPVKLLPYQYSMVDMVRKEILDEELTMPKIFPGIYQFNAIPDNSNADKTLYWMKKTYEHLYGELDG